MNWHNTVEQQWQRYGWLWLLTLPLTLLYTLVVKFRRWLYLVNYFKRYRSTVPVVVVGNIYVGGVGKTPFVIWLVSELQSAGLTVAVVSRGYGGVCDDYPVSVGKHSDAKVVGDEPLMIYHQTNAMVVVDPDRSAAVRYVEQTVDVDVIIADDGLQHYALDRDLEIVVADAERQYGNGWCLPSGPLREPISRTRHADFNLSIGGVTKGESHDIITRELACPYWLHSKQTVSWNDLPDQVDILTAISHPQRFLGMVRAYKEIVDVTTLPDHAYIESSQLDNGKVRPILVTQKDAVKLDADISATNIVVCPLNINVSADLSQRLLTAISDLSAKQTV